MQNGKSSDRFYNLLSILMLIGICCVGTWFLIVFASPKSFLNPFSPIDTGPTRTPTITPTATLPVIGPPTFTPVPSETPLPSRTPAPTSTPLPTYTPFSIVTPPTAAPSATPVFSFEPFKGHPLALGNIIHTDRGCNWLGVAGQVTYNNGAPVTGLVVKLAGTLIGKTIDKLTLTGAAPNYGPGGYEFELADEPVGSSGELYIQLLDQNGSPLSDKILFNTFADCDRNLILISFEEKGN